MPNTQYLALLRGINVGGGNLIRMADLKGCFEGCKLANVATYIQSGNVVFETSETDRARLVQRLEKALSKAFSPYQARIVLRSHAHLRRIVGKAPEGFGSQPALYRYYVIYLREPLTAGQAMPSVAMKPGVDTGATGPGVLYVTTLLARASQSHLTRVVGLPVYQDMTIRNWNTTSKLLALMDARASA
jgi:uncharacterized protein (DUF1697 family)